MGKWWMELLAEKGSVSMTRFLSLICVLSASAMALYSVHKGSDLNAVSLLCGTFLGAGIGGKVAQKVVEVKNVKEE